MDLLSWGVERREILQVGVINPLDCSIDRWILVSNLYQLSSDNLLPRIITSKNPFGIGSWLCLVASNYCGSRRANNNDDIVCVFETANIGFASQSLDSSLDMGAADKPFVKLSTILSSNGTARRHLALWGLDE